MNTKLIVLAVGAFLTLGIAMPSCPGQRAMQQQIDSLQTANAALTKKVQILESESRVHTQELSQAKQLFTQITQVIQAQKGALDQLNVAVKDLQTKLTAKTKKVVRAREKPRRR